MFYGNFKKILNITLPVANMVVILMGLSHFEVIFLSALSVCFETASYWKILIDPH